MAIVTTHYRYKRPPLKRAKAVPIEVPVVLTISKKTGRRQTEPHETSLAELPEALASSAKPAPPDRKAVIVTARKPRGRFGDAPDLTPEEHQRRGDAAETLFRELVRRAAAPSR
jgi:hypothetical protein